MQVVCRLVRGLGDNVRKVSIQIQIDYLISGAVARRVVVCWTGPGAQLVDVQLLVAGLCGVIGLGGAPALLDAPATFVASPPVWTCISWLHRRQDLDNCAANQLHDGQVVNEPIFIAHIT